MRSVGSGVDPRLGGHAFFVNGERVFVRGGNWIAADAMLRCAPGRCRREVRLHAGAVVWAGGGAGCSAQRGKAAVHSLLCYLSTLSSGVCNLLCS